MPACPSVDLGAVIRITSQGPLLMRLVTGRRSLSCTSRASLSEVATLYCQVSSSESIALGSLLTDHRSAPEWRAGEAFGKRGPRTTPRPACRVKQPHAQLPHTVSCCLESCDRPVSFTPHPGHQGRLKLVFDSDEVHANIQSYVLLDSHLCVQAESLALGHSALCGQSLDPLAADSLRAHPPTLTASTHARCHLLIPLPAQAHELAASVEGGWDFRVSGTRGRMADVDARTRQEGREEVGGDEYVRLGERRESEVRFAGRVGGRCSGDRRWRGGRS